MLVFQRMIYRVDLRANPQVIYLMGENEMYTGSGGQAAEMRGEPNMRPIRTKRKPRRDPDSYWTDLDFDRQASLVDADFMAVVREMESNPNLIVVCPLDVTGIQCGLGSGMAELPIRAPRTYNYIKAWIETLRTSHPCDKSEFKCRNGHPLLTETSWCDKCPQ